MYHVELLFHFDKKGVGGVGQGVVGFIFDVGRWGGYDVVGRGGGEGKRLTIIVILDISKASLNPHKCSFS
jgi:hypothetical protein